MTIESIRIATNRYAPSGADAISLYSNGAGTDLTFTQLVMGVCIRAAAAYESESVLKMNTMTAGSQNLDAAAGWLSQIVAGTADWAEAKAFLTRTMGISEKELPDGLDSYDKRLQAAEALQVKMDALAQSQQEEMIDLQSLVNLRDVAYSTSTNVARALGTSMISNAANF